MGSWWRSEEMSFVNLILTEASSQAVVRELGALGCIQFVDLNSELTAFQRPYMTSLKRCEELERRIRYCSNEVGRMGITIQPAGDLEEFVMKKGEDLDTRTGSYLLEGLEMELEKKEAQLRQLVDYNTKLSKQYTSKVEYHHLLIQASKFLNAASDLSAYHGLNPSIGSSGNSVAQSNYPDAEEGIAMVPMGAGGSYQDDSNSMSFSNISGVLNTSDKGRFERMLFRATRGNCYVRFAELPKDTKDADGNQIEKVCFVIFYKSTTLNVKIARICDAFGASRYDLSMINSPYQLRKTQDSNYQDLQDAKLVLDTNTNQRWELCELLAGTLEMWFWIVKREKSVYNTLNMFRSNVAGAKQLIRARGWLVSGRLDEANAAIRTAHQSVGIPQSALLERVPGNWPTPPTQFYTNKFTYAFQELVNTYGMPRYREINPAIFAAATFPFLFGVMYGDIGHGSLLSLASLFLVVTEGRMQNKRNMDGMLYNVYQARYMLLAMGLCAVYCGVVYNDYFSLGLDLFGSRYVFPEAEDGTGQGSGDSKVANGAKGSLLGKPGDPEGVYPFGCDPVWHVAGNELLFFNSMKMKMAVILGLIQMTWGILMRGLNAYYAGGFGIDFFCEFMPMIVFDVFFMGYMVVLIFLKWSIDWNQRMGLGSCAYDEHGTLGACDLGSSKSCYTSGGDMCDKNTPLADMCPLDYGGTGDGCQPANLITTLMNIALKPGQVDEPLYYGQAQVQVVLLLIAFLCVPWLMCVKPYMLYKQHHQQHRAHRYTSIGGHANAGDLPHVHNSVNDSSSSTASPMYKNIDGDDEDIGGMDSPSRHPLNPSKDGLGLHPRRTMSMDSTDSHDSMFGVGQGGEGGYHETGGHGDGEEWNFPEICIHQSIETIEFVLGMISNTASYLRLWALSLAHSELATVFWEKCLLGAIKSGNPIFIVAGFYVFAGVTGGVLLGMDVLECFLHALRLHWVEFQSKFYKADGYRFAPFSFHSALDEALLA